MTTMTSPAIHRRFRDLCRTIQERDHGMTLDQIGDCHALSAELEKPEPSPERLKWFLARLGLDPEIGEPVSAVTQDRSDD